MLRAGRHHRLKPPPLRSKSDIPPPLAQILPIEANLVAVAELHTPAAGLAAPGGKLQLVHFLQVLLSLVLIRLRPRVLLLFFLDPLNESFPPRGVHPPPRDSPFQVIQTPLHPVTLGTGDAMPFFFYFVTRSQTRRHRLALVVPVRFII